MSGKYELSIICRCPIFRFDATGWIVMDNTVMIQQDSRFPGLLECSGLADTMIAVGLLRSEMIPAGRKRKSCGATWTVERTGKSWIEVKLHRDRVQNHALTDVSARHYDRYDYAAEKREALERWCQHLRAVVGPKK